MDCKARAGQSRPAGLERTRVAGIHVPLLLAQMLPTSAAPDALPGGSLLPHVGCAPYKPASTCAKPPSVLTVLYPCVRCPWPQRWWVQTMFAGHRVVCYEAATVDDVRQAHVVVAAFRTPKRTTDGWEFPNSLLKRLGIGGGMLVGKVLVHLDDEYGARNPRTDADWGAYCAMYAGWKHVFRNYWSEPWAARVSRSHAMNCSAICPAQHASQQPVAVHRNSAASPRVEWTPLGWSANWQPGTPPRRSSTRTSLIGFYGNEKYQLRPNRGALMAKFEKATDLKVERLLGRVGFGRGNASNYVRLMHDTRLCLQISGLSAECYRMYEAFDAGCVPVLINQFGKETATQYKFLLGTGGGRGPAPFPWGESPADLKARLGKLRDDENALDAVQAETMSWWNQSLSHFRGRVQASAWTVPVEC